MCAFSPCIATPRLPHSSQGFVQSHDMVYKASRGTMKWFFHRRSTFIRHCDQRRTGLNYGTRSSLGPRIAL